MRATAIADARGQILAQGLTLPFHLGALPDALEAILKKYGDAIHEGDVFVLNDPFVFCGADLLGDPFCERRETTPSSADRPRPRSPSARRVSTYCT